MKKLFSFFAALLFAGSVFAADPITCAQAAEQALGGSTDEVTVQGYVTEIVYAWSSQYKNISFWMADTKDGGHVFEAFRVVCESEADAPGVGDLVQVTGTLTMYQSTPELAAGCTFVIIEKAQGDDPGDQPGDEDALLDIDFTQGQGAWIINDVANPDNLEKIWAQDSRYGMKATAYNNGNHESESWLISPAVDLSKATKATLAISHARRYGDNEQLAVKASADDENWETLTLSAWPDGSNWNYIDAEADLNAFAGKESVKIAFVYTSTAEAGATWEIKTVKISGDGQGQTPPDDEINTCAEAAAAALSVSENNKLYNDGAEYTIQGYVTAIQQEYNENFNNISFWMADTKDGGKVLQAYRCTPEAADKLPEVNDLVKVTGQLTKYGSTPEFAQGCKCEIVEKGEAPIVEPAENLGEKTIAEFLELKNEKDTCILTGIVANIKNTTYGNFDLVEIDNEEVSVFVYGLLTAEGEAKQFESLGVNEGDTLTVKAIYSEYNGSPQAKNAIFVSVKKKPAETFEVVITEGLRYYDFVEEEGWWQIYGDGEIYGITLSNIGEVTEAQGTYTAADLDPEYSYITVLETERDITFVGGEIKLAIDELGVVTVEGSLNGSDGNIYNIHLAYADPIVENTVEVVITDGMFDDSNVEYELYGFAGISEEGVYVQLYIITDDPVGDFTTDDLYISYSGLVIDGEPLDIYAADIKVAVADGVYTVVADLLCYNNTLYKVTLIAAGGTGVENSTIRVKAVKSIENGALIIEKNGVRYNALGQIVR